MKFYQLARLSNIKEYPPGTAENNAAHAVALLSLLALALGIVVVGFRHTPTYPYGRCRRSLYLLLPYAGQMTGRIDHLLPAALLVWAVAAYRRRSSPDLDRPLAGLIFYPLLPPAPLVPSFYGRRGFFYRASWPSILFAPGLGCALAPVLRRRRRSGVTFDKCSVEPSSPMSGRPGSDEDTDTGVPHPSVVSSFHRAQREPWALAERPNLGTLLAAPPR